MRQITEERHVESDEPENWTKAFATAYIWRIVDPFAVKFEIEKVFRLLLEREQGAQLLVYSGSTRPPTIGYNVRLCFETALPEGNWYSLNVETWVPRSWYPEAEFLDYSDRAFAHWMPVLDAQPKPSDLRGASPGLYSQRMSEAMNEEGRANQKEDPVPIAEVQQEILEELRKGRSFRTAHHEGGSSFLFDGKNFVRSNWGEDESLVVFASEEDVLNHIREFYDWESRKDTFPHRPPELEVWRYIRRQMT